MKTLFQSSRLRLAALGVTFTLLIACGGGGGGGSDGSAGGTGGAGNTNPKPLSLNQAGYNASAVAYQYGFGTYTNILIQDEPADTDWSRWAMLHDGTRYRLYFFKTGSNTTLYQFAYNPNTGVFQYGFDSIPQLQIHGAPADADPNGIAMLHDGTYYRLYMRSTSNPARIYQFKFNTGTSRYEYGFQTIPVIDVTGAPADVDWDRWAMLHDGTRYRHYAMRQGSNSVLYQFGYNPSAGDYQYGYDSVPQLTVQNMPDNSDTETFSILHDGAMYRFYYLAF